MPQMHSSLTPIYPYCVRQPFANCVRLKVSSHSVCQPVNHTRIFIQAKVNIPLCES